MNIEYTLSILRRERLLLEHAPHSAQFQDLMACLLRTFSAAAVIPALSAEEVRLYSALALLHDVGKQAIPSDILNKPGRLTREEFELVKTHTVQGCDLLERVPELRGCEAFPLRQARDMVVSGACGAFGPHMIVCFADHIGTISHAVYG